MPLDHNTYRLQVRNAMLRLALTVEPDQARDRFDDPGPMDAIQRLTQLLDSPDASLAVGEALVLLYRRWHDRTPWGPAIEVPASRPD